MTDDKKLYDLTQPLDMVKEGLVQGEPGSWDVITDFKCIIPSKVFNGAAGTRWDIAGDIVYADLGYAWNGSNVVKDKTWCIPASMVHDMLCEYLHTLQASWFKKWRLRRKADKIYAQICDAQGATKARSIVRLIGLRLRSLWPW